MGKDAATHWVYHYMLECGCYAGMFSERNLTKASVQRIIHERLQLGYMLKRVPIEAPYGRCTAYPHARWQKEYEQRLVDFQRS